MLGIMAGMDQKDFVRHVQGLVYWVLTMSLALCSSWLSQAQDVSYVEVHRRSSWTRSLTCPLVCYEWRHGPDSAENCLAIPLVQLIITVIFIPVVAQRQIPWSRLSVGPFSSPVNTVADVPVAQVVLAIPVVVNDRCARLRLCRKLLRSRSLLLIKFVDNSLLWCRS